LIPPSLEVLSLEEGWLEEGRHEARLVARRRWTGRHGNRSSDARC
jgi:hypothetical protein